MNRKIIKCGEAAFSGRDNTDIECEEIFKLWYIEQVEKDLYTRYGFYYTIYTIAKLLTFVVLMQIHRTTRDWYKVGVFCATMASFVEVILHIDQWWLECFLVFIIYLNTVILMYFQWYRLRATAETIAKRRYAALRSNDPRRN